MAELNSNDRGDSPEGEPVLVSACLLGRSCTYRGDSNADDVLPSELSAEGLVPVPFCPEEAGGLSTPRPPADLTASAREVLDGHGEVRTDGGVDVTEAFVRGAHAALDLCRTRQIRRAFLKERSPSCGCAATHVGGEVVQGPGVTTELLRGHGVRCEGVEGRRGSAKGDVLPPRE